MPDSENRTSSDDEMQKKIERSQERSEKEAETVRSETEKRTSAADKELAAELEKAQKEREEYAAAQLEEQKRVNEEARQVRDYEQFLHESELEHRRQPNEGDEDYSELPDDINVPSEIEHNDGSLDGKIAPMQDGHREPPDLDELIAEERRARERVEPTV